MTLVRYNSATGEYLAVQPDDTLTPYDIEAVRAEQKLVHRLVDLHHSKFVMCTEHEYESITLHKVYKVIAYEPGHRVHDDDDGTFWVRIENDDGEERSYSPGYFVPVYLPEVAEHHFAPSGHPGAKELSREDQYSVRCVSGEGWDDLTVGKVYRVYTISKYGSLRVVDDSREDWLYPPKCFEVVTDAE